VKRSRSAPVGEILNTVQAARYLGCSKQLLEILRCRGGGPPYAKIGALVRYRKMAIDGWIAANEVLSTSEKRP